MAWRNAGRSTGAIAVAWIAVLGLNTTARAAARGEPEPIAWSELGAKATAQAGGKGLDLAATPDGARLTCAYQRLAGEATPEGLWLASTVASQPAARFRLKAAALGRSGQEPLAVRLPERGRVEVGGGLVRWVRPGLVEEYAVSMDGVRQDFVVAEPPAGEGSLRVELALDGARAEAAPDGARLTLDGSGRRLAYSRLRVTDADNRDLGPASKSGARAGWPSSSRTRRPAIPSASIPRSATPTGSPLADSRD